VYTSMRTPGVRIHSQLFLGRVHSFDFQGSKGVINIVGYIEGYC